MAYTHLTINELIWIEEYFKIGIATLEISRRLKRARQTIHNVVASLKAGGNVQEYYQRYKENNSKCGRKKYELTENEVALVKEKVASGWTPDVIIGRGEHPLNCSTRTLYRRFKEDDRFDITTLPMRGKRKENGHQEKRGKQAFRRTIHDREETYPLYNSEFGHLEGDTIIGKDHKSCVITLVERVSKCIITLKPEGRKAEDIEKRVNAWLNKLPKNIFKSITFDCGKEFSNWKSISSKQDIDIFFADPGRPSQRGLNENSNGLLRRDGLPKQTDFNQMDESYIQSVASFRNSIPRKSLNYKTPVEVLVENICGKLSNLY